MQLYGCASVSLGRVERRVRDRPPFDRAPRLRTSPIGSGPMDVLVPPYVPYPLTLVSSTCAMSLSAK
jgi:hypothetical protein